MIALAAAAAAALAGCGNTSTTPPEQLTTPAEKDAYAQCKQWAHDGRSQADVGALIGTYVASNSFSKSENGAVTSACAKGFVDGGGG